MSYRRNTSLFPVFRDTMRHELSSINLPAYLFYAPIAQRIERSPAKAEIEVQFLMGAHSIKDWRVKISRRSR